MSARIDRSRGNTAAILAEQGHTQAAAQLVMRAPIAAVRAAIGADPVALADLAAMERHERPRRASPAQPLIPGLGAAAQLVLPTVAHVKRRPRKEPAQRPAASDLYGVIYADPPWSYDQKVRATLGESHYQTMSPADLAALPVAKLAAPDCALFIWGTWPLLPVVLSTITAWGFEYKTLGFVWVKTTSRLGALFTGCGSWSRANTEPCFLATRGAPRRVNAGVHSVIEEDDAERAVYAPNVRHSQKPAAARDRIEQLMGADGKRIELFARHRSAGWHAWGNEVESDVTL